jgi:hypothetical protein
MRYKYHWLGLAFLAIGIVRLVVYARHGKHFLWLLPLILVGAVSAHELTINNLSGSPFVLTNDPVSFSFTIPMGISKIPLEPNFIDQWNANIRPIDSALGDDNFPIIDASSDVSLWIFNYGGVQHSYFGLVPDQDIQSTTDYSAAVAAGFGSGLLWFGFGWKLRIIRQTVADS